VHQAIGLEIKYWWAETGGSSGRVWLE